MPESRVHIVCRECGRRSPTLAGPVTGPCASVGRVAGFVVDHVDVTLLGRCATCVSGQAREDVAEAG